MYDGVPQIYTPKIRAQDLIKLDKAELAYGLSQLEPAEVSSLLNSWRFWARDEQISPDGEWGNWIFLGGRGSGKTKSGAEWTKELVTSYPGIRMALVAPTAGDLRDTMIYGTSGLMSLDWPSEMRPHHIASQRAVFWPNGSTALTYSAEKPDRLRGPNLHAAWADEFAAWRYAEQAWDMLQLCLRLEYPGTSSFPRTYVSTTPKSVKILRDLIGLSSTVITRGSTYRNRANLAKKWFANVVSLYEGSTLGRQEIWGELIDDLVGALWKRKWINVPRLSYGHKPPPCTRRVIGVDPASSELASANECGIIAAERGEDDRCYVIGDFSTHAESPTKWGKKICDAFELVKADCVVVEQNLGGGLVESVIRNTNPNIPLRFVMAKQGKHLRAEPVAMLYEQGKVSHCGTFAKLEDQMCIFTPTYQKDNPGLSPDRVDAAVYAIGALMLESYYDASMKWVG